MKIYIHYKFTDQPYGGGNQFLKTLKNYLIKNNLYETNPDKAQVILYNSFEGGKEVLRLKLKYPQKIFIHRIDGPIRLYNRINDKRDILTNIINQVADGTIFQSNWSQIENYKLILKKRRNEVVILNAPDSTIFNNLGRRNDISKKEKIRIIATSWSKNIKKGFKDYQWMDENIDFSKYEMTFVGNSPIKYQNIKHIQPLHSQALSIILKKHHIYITASEKDPCSNALLEALHCGLPALGRNDGGHPEIIKTHGELFNMREEIPKLLEKIINNYDNYSSPSTLPNIEQIGDSYYKFALNIYDNFKNCTYQPIRINYLRYGRLYAYLVFYGLVNKLEMRFHFLRNKCKN